MIDIIKHLLEGRYRISTQLYLGIGGAVVLTMGASLVGWFSFNSVGDAQSRVNEGSVPGMAAAFGVAQQSGAIVAAAPRLIAAATPETFDQVIAEIATERNTFEAQLAALTQQGEEEERFSRIRAQGGTLISNIEEIECSMAELFVLQARSEALRAELAELRNELVGVLVPLIDDQLFYAMTGYRNLDEAPASPAQHLSKKEFDHYRHLAALQADATTAIQLLSSAFNLSDAPLIEPLRERFEAAKDRIEWSLSALGMARARSQIAPICARLYQLGLGEEGGFDLRTRELELAGHQRDLLARNQSLALDLVAEAEGLVNAARISAKEATHASTLAIGTGRSLLLVLNVISITGALLIAYLFVGRMLLPRLERLSARMRMADGDLEGKVDIGGNDEVADMAAALEVFRRHALEVQRLNLVEKLAEELQSKNEELEKVLDDLRVAQDQIVMREKLASLGELTAGVAHEIKNPLNFVKNFSESSEELMEELVEVLDESPGALSEEQRELVDEICQDLTDNMGRILQHGNRADRIVHDMLMMGRGSGERQSIEINNLLDEHARLAYHSARATDADFNLTIETDFDPNVGQIEAVPQDLGRVFLNMVGNACYATDEKRRAIEADDGETFFPTLSLSTRRMDDRIEVSIRDNGNGIPPEVVDKIFNPFFTTKPTDKGTGLGLALSNDIVREHGGNIRVVSEPGEFTEMIVELPLVPPAVTTEEVAR
ncbi:MAG: HAMP domain-containing protein [Gemmatimonadetes bacterium]|nr:HAMP domain-containing protein [Gemmatimonadota bacterium]